MCSCLVYIDKCLQGPAFFQSCLKLPSRLDRCKNVEVLVRQGFETFLDQIFRNTLLNDAEKSRLVDERSEELDAEEASKA